MKVSFIGAGNMAHALIAGLIANNIPADQLWASNIDTSRLHNLQQHGVHTTQNNCEAAERADVVVLSVKPQVMQTVCEELKSTVRDKNPLVISIAAGVRVASIQQWLGDNAAIVRAMPNMTVSVSAGATGLFALSNVTEEQRSQAESLFQSTGMAVWVEQESQLDIVTAVSGSGPAYIFLMLEAIQAAAVELGLSAQTAEALTAQMSVGASRMALELDKDVSELRAAVTSPNGTTAAALDVFAKTKFTEIVKDAVKAAYDRSVELSKL